MSALRKAQFEHDEKLPPPVSESSQELARSEWLFNAVEQLVQLGCDVKFQRRMRKPQGVTVAELVAVVDEYANNRLADCEVQTPSLGRLLIANNCGRADKVSTAELLGPSDHVYGKPGEIAEAMLRPLVNDALIALAEDDEP